MSFLWRAWECQHGTPCPISKLFPHSESLGCISMRGLWHGADRTLPCREQKLPHTWRGLWTSEHVPRKERQLAKEDIMSTAGIAAPEMRVPLKSSFLHNGEGVGSLKTCWSSHRGFEK